ncbi:sensor domain-containing diguanylate cyclase [Acinetobacter guerrae]|uniref:sensor domain-containing diguanylate cyclase n=1 Tax=Acinetobacter guerrae TaxID=1843371 RepID=UPI00125F456C|nr:sensor domain-containing diguanylate cyclase [Acinetobacter guerrae]
MQTLDSSIFDLAPIPMWLEDYSDIKTQFNAWRAQGIEDLYTFLSDDLDRVRQCAHKIKIISVNQKTLDLFEANSQEHLCDNLDRIFQEDMFKSHIHELVDLWEGKTQFSSVAVNYSLSGKRLDIQLRGAILPGYEQSFERLLITTEDVTTYQNARRLEEKNRRLAEARFVYSPASLWVEDFSRVKVRIDQLKQIGIDDFRTFLDVHPEFVNQCIEDILILDVNQATLDLFQAPDKQTLLKNIHKVFSNEMLNTFREQLIELWKGNIHHQREAVNYALDGTIRNVLLQFTVFPSYEEDWGLIQVALTDITARKKAENYLEYLGKHDVLTKLYNRSFFTEELNRLERSILRPVSCIFLDMNGLKEVNDQLGHDVGDGLLRRVGSVLTQAIQNTTYTASRIGGDEFVILMPGTDEVAVLVMLQTIQELFNIDNQYYSSQPISMSFGSATTLESESIESMLKRADQQMYQRKKHFYQDKEAI